MPWIRCPYCQVRLEAAPRHLSQVIVCPDCSSYLKIVLIAERVQSTITDKPRPLQDGPILQPTLCVFNVWDAYGYTHLTAAQDTVWLSARQPATILHTIEAADFAGAKIIMEQRYGLFLRKYPVPDE